MKCPLTLIAGILWLTGDFVAQAQFRAPGGLPPGFHHALFDVLGAGPAFSGHALIHLSDGTNKAPETLSCDIAVLSGTMRLEVDTFETGTNVPPSEAANLKEMHTISILRPDLNRMYLVYPMFHSYVEVPYSKSTGTNSTPPPNIGKSFITNVMVGIQGCVESDWEVTENNGEQYGLLVWSATNLNNFPIRIQLGSPPVTVDFETVHMETPDGSLFVPPPTYIRYEGIQEIIQREAAKPQTAASP
jgi:hypothetical protein